VHRIHRFLALVLVTGWAALFLGNLALAASTGHEKESPKLSPGMEQLLKDIRELRRSRLEQLNAEIEQLIDQAAREGRITAAEAARLREWRQMRRLGLSLHATEDEVKERLDEAVKSGRITKDQAKKLFKEWQAIRRSHQRGRP